MKRNYFSTKIVYIFYLIDVKLLNVIGSKVIKYSLYVLFKFSIMYLFIRNCISRYLFKLLTYIFFSFARLIFKCTF